MAKVLIVDDEDVIRRFLGVVLDLNDIEYVLAANPQEALEFVRVQTFDAVISDRSIPATASGEQLVLDVLAIRPTMPIIMLTGDAITQAPPGVCKLLHKPIAPTVLLKAVQEVLGNRSVAKPTHVCIDCDAEHASTECCPG